MFEEEPKARCPDCQQSLTFVRTKSHEKRWYCYGCEKYVDHIPQTPSIKDSHVRLETLSGLQVVDSHGILVGRVRKAIPTDSGDIKSLLLSVDKEQFKTLLDDRDLSREFEVSHDKIATVGDVVILADVFSKCSRPREAKRYDARSPLVRKMWGSTSPRSQTLHQMRFTLRLDRLSDLSNNEPCRGKVLQELRWQDLVDF